jgi:hypothetical protein
MRTAYILYLHIWLNLCEHRCSALFTTFHADTPDGERLPQETLSQRPCFRASVHVSGQKQSRFQGIYQRGRREHQVDRRIGERSKYRHPRDRRWDRRHRDGLLPRPERSRSNSARAHGMRNELYTCLNWLQTVFYAIVLSVRMWHFHPVGRSCYDFMAFTTSSVERTACARKW